MKRLFVILYLADALFLILFSHIIIWWKREHNVPGLAEMINIKFIILYLIIAVVLFIVLTVAIIYEHVKRK